MKTETRYHEPNHEDRFEPAHLEEAATEPPPEPGKSVEPASDLRARWDTVEAGFVDDPQGAVAEASTLVKEAADRLVASFEEQRARLERQWASEGDGEAISTEELRVTLQRYRTLFAWLQDAQGHMQRSRGDQKFLFMQSSQGLEQ
jgi:hypothetical protein